MNSRQFLSLLVNAADLELIYANQANRCIDNILNVS